MNPRSREPGRGQRGCFERLIGTGLRQTLLK